MPALPRRARRRLAARRPGRRVDDIRPIRNEIHAIDGQVQHHVNPGSAIQRRLQPRCTVGWVELDDGSVRAVSRAVVRCWKLRSRFEVEISATGDGFASRERHRQPRRFTRRGLGTARLCVALCRCSRRPGTAQRFAGPRGASAAHWRCCWRADARPQPMPHNRRRRRPRSPCRRRPARRRNELRNRRTRVATALRLTNRRRFRACIHIPVSVR